MLIQKRTINIQFVECISLVLKTINKTQRIIETY